MNGNYSSEVAPTRSGPNEPLLTEGPSSAWRRSSVSSLDHHEAPSPRLAPVGTPDLRPPSYRQTHAGHRPGESDIELRDVSPGSSGANGALSEFPSKLDSPEGSPTARRPSLLGAWWWELLTWLFGTLAILAIILLLAFFNKKALSHWKSRIGINTIVSTLSQAAQSALLVSLSAGIGQLKWTWYQNKDRGVIDIKEFDDASRGPEGSLVLLWKRRGMNLVSLGAFTTVLMLTLSPFAQQAVKIDARRWVLSDSVAQIGRAVEYHTTNDSIGWDIFGGSGSKSSDYIDEIGPTMKQAIYVGMTGNNMSPSNVTGSCPTTNCKWEPYTSLAVCSTVEDVSSTLVQDCLPPNDPSSKIVGCTCSIEAFKNSVASKPNNITGSPPNLTWTSDTLWFSSNYDTDYTRLISDSRNTLIEIYLIYKTNLSTSYYEAPKNNSDCTAAGLAALKGTLQLCLQTFDTNMANGTASTNISATHDNLVWTQQGTTFYSDVTASIPGDTTNYAADMSTISSLGSYLSVQTFNGHASVLMSSGGDNYFYSDSARSLAQDLWGQNFSRWDPQASFDGFEARLNNLSTSMTNTLRTGANTTTNFPGQAWSSEQFIHVDFIWLTVPIALCLLTTVFLITTIIQTTRRKAPLWKSSALALLQCQEPHALDSITDMKVVAKTERAQLKQPVGYNWRLVRRRVVKKAGA